MTDLPPPPADEPGPVEPAPVEPATPFSLSDEAPGAMAVGYPSAETLDNEPPPRGSRRGLVIGATAAVLAVVAGAAVYATTVLSGGGRQPDEVVPKATFAYAKVDLDPAAGQKLAARSFFDKFPKLKAKTGTSNENPFEQLLEAFISDPNVTYATDVKPWFDRRAAVAVFPGQGGAVTVTVLRSKDDAKAKEALDKVLRKTRENGDDLGYRIAKGYVVISDTQTHVDEAIRLSDVASLRDNDVYRKDVDTLTGDQVGTAWVDIAPAFHAAIADIPQGGLVPTAIADRIKGRLVAGLHFAGDYVEVEGKGYGLDQKLAPQGTSPTLLTDLPASTVAAISVAGLGTSADELLKVSGLDVTNLVDGFLEGSGLTFRGDILPLLGDQTVLAVGNVLESFEKIKVALVSAVKDATKSETSGTKVAAALQQLGLPAKATVRGNTFYLAVPSTYADELAKGGGGLGESAKFTKATGDLGTPGFVMYVDLQAFVGAFNEPDFAPLRSFGAVGGMDNGVAYFRERLVVG